MKQRRKFRTGVASVLAMLYLVLFASLAVGFYTATNISSQVVENERRTAQAQLAAESGMDFIRYHLANVNIPHRTTQAELFTILHQQLVVRLTNTGNMSGHTVAASGGLIQIPGNPDSYLRVDSSGGRFRVSIEDLGQKVRVKVIGGQVGSPLRRAIQMEYAPAEKASRIFDYGIASKGKVSTAGSAVVRGATDPLKGSVLSMSADPNPVDIQGPLVSGDISIATNGLVTFKSGTSIGGTSNPNTIRAEHIHKEVTPPEFPTIDTTAIQAYAVNPYTGGTVLNNVFIPPNTNPNFTSDTTIIGVLLIQPPNIVTFRGSTSIQGVIVTPPASQSTGTMETNIVDFRGNITARGVETLPDSYGDLKKLTGAFLLGENFQAKFSGNFGDIYGSILADTVTMGGGAQGVIHGSIVTLKDAPLSITGNSSIIIASTGTTNYPAGVFFSSRYFPLRDTYEEVQP